MPIKIEDGDQTTTERPVGGQESTQVEELDIDFRVPLPFVDRYTSHVIFVMQFTPHD